MSTGKIDITLRPLKLAFLLNPSDKKNLLQVIKLNSFIWGGIFNPIIPIHTRKPKYWESYTKFNMQDMIESYLDSYDPDFIVCTSNEQTKINVKNRNLIQLPDILPNVQDNHNPCYGISLFNILNKYHEKEGRFLQKHPSKIIIPEIISNQNEVFLSSIFGALTTEVDEIVRKYFDEPLEIFRQQYQFNEYFKYFDISNLYPTRIVRHYVKNKNLKGLGSSNILFYMDATSNIDIIDYWNLRAAGCNIVPIPKQLISSSDLIDFSRKFIENNFFQHKRYEHVNSKVSLIKSRDTLQKDSELFCTSLLNDSIKGKFLFQTWYPQIWDRRGAKSDSLVCCNLETKTNSMEISNQKKISVGTIFPEFLRPNDYNGTPQFANEIRINIYNGDGEIFGEVIPDGGMEMARSFGIFGNEWRCGKGVLVHLANNLTSLTTITFPEAHTLFSIWLSTKKYSSKLSTAGLLAKNIYKQLGGDWGIHLLADKKILEMLDDMSGGKTHLNRLINTIKEELKPLCKEELKKEEVLSLIEKHIWILEESENYGINHRALIGKLTRIIKEEDKRFTADVYLKNLIDANILRLGKEIQCSNCQRLSWYPVNSLNYNLKCPKCIEEFRLPQESSEKIKWSYSSVGSLRQPNYAGGAYTVLLTMRFFSHILDASITPYLSFNANYGSKKIEADLALFYQNKFQHSNPSLIFAECKSLNSFQDYDINRMQIIVDSFPGSVIVFATLKDELNNNEKKLIKKFINFNRKRWIKSGIQTPVIILNATELLCSDSFLTMAWEKKGGTHKKLSKMYSFNDLNALSDYTIEIYLGLPSAMTYWMSKNKKD